MVDGRLPYLPALDGLRALAVALVVAYHLDLGWATGGFLGVDLFFVISGFLITTLLLRERTATGAIDLRGFWVRRFRRLVPPLVAMIAVTVLATRWWGVPEQWESVRLDAVSALGYLANWWFVIGGESYFQSLLGPSPLRHTWSLAVEEQWYLVWPLIVIGLVAFASRSARRAGLVVPILIGAALASAALMAMLYDPSDPSRVYYGTDTRAQQLLIGAALAWLVSRHGAMRVTAPRRASVIAGAALLAFVIVATTTTDQAPWLYRGGFLLMSVVAAIVVLGVSRPTPPASLRWMAWPPLVAIGVRSYGIYLWHWPVIVFVGAPMGIDVPRPVLIALQLALTLLLAEASLRLIERPVRRPTRRPLRIVGGWALGSVGVALLALFVLVPPAGRQQLALDSIEPDAEVLAARRAAVSTTTPPESATTAPPSTESTVAPPARSGPATTADTSTSTTVPAGPRLVHLTGDSTAITFAINLPAPQTDERWQVQTTADLGCFVTGGRPLDGDRPVDVNEKCFDWEARWANDHDELQPDVSVMMIGPWEMLDHRVDDLDVRFPSDAWGEHVRTSVEDAVSIVGTAETPVVLLAPPCMSAPGGDSAIAAARTEDARVDAFNAILRDIAADRPQTYVFELGDVLCPDGTPIEAATGSDIRFDGVHVTPDGSAAVADWLFAELDRQFPLVS